MGTDYKTDERKGGPSLQENRRIIRRPLCWIGLILFLCAAAFCILYPGSGWLLPVCILLGTGGIICLIRQRNRPFAPFFFAAVFMFVYCVLFGRFAAKPALSLSGQTLFLSGDVIEAGGSSFLLDGKTQSGQRIKVQVWCSTDEAPDRFQQFFGSVQLSEITATDRFDSESYYRSRGVYLQGQMLSGEFTTPGFYPPWTWPGRLSDSLCRKIRSMLPKEASGLVCAVILGNRSYLSEESYQLFQQLGIGHLLAVSGIHLTLLTGMFSRVVNRFLRRRTAKLLLSMGFVLFYMLLTGLGPSVSRAGIMLLLSYLAQLISRRVDPPTSLGTAVLLMLLWNPFLAMNTGFQLSVCSTVGVRILAGPLGEKLRFPKGRKLPIPLSRLIEAFCAALCAYACTLPLTVLYDGQLIPMAIPANLLLSPLFVPLLALSAGFVFFGFIPIIGPFLAYCVRLLAGIFLRLAGLLVQIGPKPIYWSGVAPVICTVCLAAVIAYGAVKRDRQRFAALLCLAVVVCGCSVSTQALVENRQVSCYTAAFDKRLLQIFSYDKHAVVIGHLSSQAQIEQAALELKRAGVSVIDALVLLPVNGRPRVSLSGLTREFSVEAVLISPTDSLTTQAEESLSGAHIYDFSVCVSFWQTGSVRLSEDGAADIRIGTKKLLILPADCAILYETDSCWDLAVTAWDIPPPAEAKALLCARNFWGKERENPNAYLLSYGHGVRYRIPLK